VGCTAERIDWFHLCGHVTSHDDKFPALIDEVTLQDLKNGVWCAMSATKITGLICI
jgi:hypothetical protein